jgi:hypothetical protein
LAEIMPGVVYWFAVKSVPPGGSDDHSLVKKRLLEYFAALADPVRPLVEATPSENIIRNDLQDIPPFRPWSDKLVCLIGDAAHPMTYKTILARLHKIDGIEGLLLAAGALMQELRRF